MIYDFKLLNLSSFKNKNFGPLSDELKSEINSITSSFTIFIIDS